MNVSLYQAAAALTANSQWQDVISENLASSSVSGFRKQSLTTAAVQAGLLPVSGQNGPGAPKFFSMPKADISVSFKTGQMDFTGDDKNVGIDGPGFFQVELAGGTQAVTRDGEFQINGKGNLVTKEGYLVMDNSGNAIKLDPHNHNSLIINANGQIKQGDQVKGTIGLTDYENPELLKQTDGVYFIADDPKLVTKPATGSMREGFVEAANTTALSEMSDMMTAMRTFEANQHVIQIQDDRMNKAITELGNPS